MNSRRVMLKNVPATMSEADIVQLIHELAGNVSKIFRYEPEKSTGVHSATSRRHRTYSVLMDDEDAANRLTSLRKIPLPSPSIGEITIEKFQFKHKKIAKVAAHEISYGVAAQLNSQEPHQRYVNVFSDDSSRRHHDKTARQQ